MDILNAVNIAAFDATHPRDLWPWLPIDHQPTEAEQLMYSMAETEVVVCRYVDTGEQWIALLPGQTWGYMNSMHWIRASFGIPELGVYMQLRSSIGPKPPGWTIPLQYAEFHDNKTWRG